jgi:hypothetical protein
MHRADHIRFLPSVLALLAASPAPAQQAAHPSCEPAPPHRQRADTVLASGDYTLTLVTTRGLKAGSQATGSLWLNRTSPSDRSPKTGRRPAPSNQNGVPLYGAADLDFERVGAPVFRDDALVPLPESRDPVRPGVVVLVQNWQSDTLPRGLVLVIGSLTNRRDDEGWLDGPGIGLWVRSTRDHDFFGTWSEFGIIRGGEGHFCARYVGP